MNLTVSGHHLELTQPIRDYLDSKFERLTRHFDHVIDVNVILSVERLQRKVEATVHVRGRDLFAVSQEADMYAAIDGLIDKLDRQIVKHKEKLKDGRGESPARHRGA